MDIFQWYELSRNKLPIFEAIFDTTKTSTGSSASNQIKLPLTTNFPYTIEWGDGTINTVTSTSDTNLTHTYSSAGVKTIKIRGTIKGFSFNNSGDRLKIFKINSWGDFYLGQDSGYYGSNFYGCTNLDLSTTIGIPKLGFGLLNVLANCTSLTTINNINSWDFSSVTNATNLFYGCSNFNQSLNISLPIATSIYGIFQNCSKLNSSITLYTPNVTSVSTMFSGCSIFNSAITINTGNITNMTSMFEGCTAFNQNINYFDTSKVTAMQRMFYGCIAFNQSLNSWITSNVTNISYMFRNCTNFNGNISSWNTSKVTTLQETFYGCSNFNQDISGWDTGNVTIMNSTFYNCSKFNQNIGSWNTAKITNMYGMLTNCVLFNQDINGWNVSLVTDMTIMLFGCTAFNQDISAWNFNKNVNLLNFMYGKTSGNYSAVYCSNLLIKFASSFIGSGRSTAKNIHFGSIKRDASGTAAYNALIADGFTITGATL